MSEVAERADLPSGATTVLRHPRNTAVYLVGVAHVSAQAARDAEDCIAAVQPAIVVLELDEKRYERLLANLEKGDPYGLQRATQGGTFQPLKVIFGGHLMEYGLNVAYATTGALLGVPPGAEFWAAAQAAQQVGAEIVLADRDAETTLRRLSKAALASSQRPDKALITMEDDVQKECLEQPQQRSSGDHLLFDQPPDQIGKPDQLVEGMETKWRGVLQQAGCQHPDTVLNAFKHILAGTTGKTQAIQPEDILTIRECGTKVVETYRQKAMKEDSPLLDIMEMEALQVLLRERDLILARRLWEAADKAAGRPVVGIVGAGHVHGIRKHWDWAGTPQAQRIVDELCTAPAPNTTGSIITAGITGAGFTWLAVKRPRIAMWALGITAAMTAPYVGAMAYAVTRWTNLLKQQTMRFDFDDGMDMRTASNTCRP